MKKILVVTTLILFTISVTYILLHDHFTGHFPWDPIADEDTIHAKIHSSVLNEDREVIIHLPHDYDSGAKYPVMYVLDGSSEDNHIAEKFNILSAAGYAPKTIVVGIPNMTAENRERNLTPPFMRTDVEDSSSANGEGDKFLLFMESELIPYMEKNYGASPVRLFTGNSRGGLLVMYSLLYEPDLFNARFCYSTPFWRQDNILVTKVSDFLSSADTLHTFVYMSAGENETANIKNGLDRMRKTFQDKAPTGFTWHAEYIPHAVHQDNIRISAASGIGKWCEYVRP